MLMHFQAFSESKYFKCSFSSSECELRGVNLPKSMFIIRSSRCLYKKIFKHSTVQKEDWTQCACDNPKRSMSTRLLLLSNLKMEYIIKSSSLYLGVISRIIQWWLYDHFKKFWFFSRMFIYICTYLPNKTIFFKLRLHMFSCSNCFCNMTNYLSDPKDATTILEFFRWALSEFNNHLLLMFINTNFVTTYCNVHNMDVMLQHVSTCLLGLTL